MTEAEARECIDLLKGLFPKGELTETELDVFGFEIATRFEKADCLSTIRAHRLKNDFLRPKLSAILEELHTRRNVFHAEGERKKLDDRAIGALERSHSKVHGRDFNSMGDIEFALRYARSLWKSHIRPYETATEKTEQHKALIQRRYADIRREAKLLLVKDCGMDDAAAGNAMTVCFQHDDHAFNREATEWNSFRSEAQTSDDLETVW